MADHKKRFETIIRKLAHNGHRITPQRQAIVEILARSKGHPSVENIHHPIEKDLPTMSLATVYKNIELIKSVGEVLELGFPEHCNRYDGNRPYSRPHLICTKCRRMMDSDLESLEEVTRELSSETGFRVISHRFDFFWYLSGLSGIVK